MPCCFCTDFSIFALFCSGTPWLKRVLKPVEFIKKTSPRSRDGKYRVNQYQKMRSIITALTAKSRGMSLWRYPLV